MALSPTAARMLDSLPIYYESEPLIERILQAWANEVDRMDARLDAIKDGLVPTLATDELGMLALWEAHVGLPVDPAGASVSQRVAKVTAVLQAIGAGTAALYMATITTALGSLDWVLLRDTPGDFQDTLQMPYESGSYNAVQVEAIARRMHPAHRQLFVTYGESFILDLSPLDLSTF